MKSRDGISVILMSLILLVSFSGFITTSASANKAKVEVIVGFVAQPDAEMVKRHGGEIHHTYTIITAMYVSLPEEAIEPLRKNPKIAYIHENGKVEALEQTIPWGIDRIKAPQAWAESTGTSAKIAIFDTGVSPHEDLMVHSGYDFVNSDASTVFLITFSSLYAGTIKVTR